MMQPNTERGIKAMEALLPMPLTLPNGGSGNASQHNATEILCQIESALAIDGCSTGLMRLSNAPQ
jgi:hypothetical protein